MTGSRQSHNIQHPTYKALAELGKALKTIFLCRYLQLIELRREIEEGLNVIENWNSANGFIFFGKASEMASNRQKDRKLSMLALHLLQICMVYVNTLMIQRILAERPWASPPQKGGLMRPDAADLRPCQSLWHLPPRHECTHTDR